VCELDGKLYFVHDTGVWEYDGASMRNVSLPVFQTMLLEMGRTEVFSGEGMASPPGSGVEPGALSAARAVGDDIEGVLKVLIYQRDGLSGGYIGYVYAYNVRSGLWSRVGHVGTSDGATGPVLFVNASSVDLHDFFNPLGGADVDVRSMVIDNNGTGFGLQYPVAADTAFITPSFAAGNFGSINKSEFASRFYAETMPGSDSAPFASCTLQGYSDAARNTESGDPITATYTSALDLFDARIMSRFYTVTVVVADDKMALLSGVGVGAGEVGR
jgi:hypothetical protein